MDGFASMHCFSTYEADRYLRYKRACIALGREYMSGLRSVEDVVAFLQHPPAHAYPGISRTLRLISLGCWLAQRDGAALSTRTLWGHSEDTSEIVTPQLWSTERAGYDAYTSK